MNEDYYTPPSAARKMLYFIWDLFKVVCISFAIIIPVRYFLIQPFYVKGASMEPSFYDHEYLIIDEISYRFDEPARGDIVVFKYPKDPSQFFIKRVVAVPGETVEVKDGYVFVYDSEGKKSLLNEFEYLSAEVKTNGDDNWTLKEGQYYVLGDNREHSLDSRAFGPIEQDLIVGKVWLRGWPLDRAKVFEKVDYQ